MEILFLLLMLTFSAISDIRYRRVSNKVFLVSLFIKILFIIVNENPFKTAQASVFTACAVTLPLVFVVIITEKILKKQVMGGADIKLIFLCGLYLNIDFLLNGLLVSLSLVALVGVFDIIKKRNRSYPFVPFLTIGVFLSVLLPATVEGYYLTGHIYR